MSHEVITIGDEDSVVCTTCTLRNIPASRVCIACSAPLQEEPHRLCSACTYLNGKSATMCSMCGTPLVYELENEKGDGFFTPFGLQPGTGNGPPAWASDREWTNLGGSSSNSSMNVPTVDELRARTVAAGGDLQASTSGLIPRIHERLSGELMRRRYAPSRKIDDDSKGEGGERGRGNTSEGAGSGPGGKHERQTFIRRQGTGRGGLELCLTDGPLGNGGGGAGGRGGGGAGQAPAAAEWRLCEPRTSHYSQRRFHGSSFSCGYRNIQMVCSALMEYPEYKRVLFGGSGCVPGVPLLQCWIERAWADGYDPQGCEQLGGSGALMGSETWIGATECAALLRSFGVKAEVIDFESRSALTAPPDGSRGSGGGYGEPTPSGGGCGGDVPYDGQDDSKRRKTVESFSFSSWASPPAVPTATSGNGGGGSSGSIEQRCVRSPPLSLMLKSPLDGDRRPGLFPAAVPGGKSGGGGGCGMRQSASPPREMARRWPGTGQPLGTAATAGPAATAAAAGDGTGGSGQGGVLCSDRRGGGGGGGRGCASAGRGGQRGGRGGRGSIGKDAGDRMGRALSEWAWEYFCTPWGTKGDESPRPGGVNGGGDSRGDSGGHGSDDGGHGSPSNRDTRSGAPPPLYFQHDGHSRSIVGVCRRTAQQASQNREVGEGGGGRGGRGRLRGGYDGGGGRTGTRQPGSLLVFDPSHTGRKIQTALDDTRQNGWARLLKRGEHALHRRQFQIVATRPGLVEAGQADAWKTIVSEQVWVD